ncbi:UNKNOWN [Stylonychia lemnae]|uniref:Uncharacterized protein n=1 Tax=Stylonychia lemnae TaxID=5949 RepID=A0A078AJ21_STYLE|nr:UNKNOWN [Stylonychia lemnae]|eukprot:CDW82325.1 UNKNOWN [Stylonychia lemnae]
MQKINEANLPKWLKQILRADLYYRTDRNQQALLQIEAFDSDKWREKVSLWFLTKIKNSDYNLQNPSGIYCYFKLYQLQLYLTLKRYNKINPVELPQFQNYKTYCDDIQDQDNLRRYFLNRFLFVEINSTFSFKHIDGMSEHDINIHEQKFKQLESNLLDDDNFFVLNVLKQKLQWCNFLKLPQLASQVRHQLHERLSSSLKKNNNQNISLLAKEQMIFAKHHEITMKKKKFRYLDEQTKQKKVTQLNTELKQFCTSSSLNIKTFNYISQILTIMRKTIIINSSNGSQVQHQENNMNKFKKLCLYLLGWREKISNYFQEVEEFYDEYVKNLEEVMKLKIYINKDEDLNKYFNDNIKRLNRERISKNYLGSRSFSIQSSIKKRQKVCQGDTFEKSISISNELNSDEEINQFHLFESSFKSTSQDVSISIIENNDLSFIEYPQYLSQFMNVVSYQKSIKLCNPNPEFQDIPIIFNNRHGENQASISNDQSQSSNNLDFDENIFSKDRSAEILGGMDFLQD